MGDGEMLMRYKKYAKAKEVLEGYLKRNPGDVEVQAFLKKCKGIIGKVRKLGDAVGKIKK
ncbi:MAG: tetratricopeptide repeat protein [Nitrospirae bacterium]|nr:tetratricopeptide repeat protein [Nitrospirota bacterium]